MSDTTKADDFADMPTSHLLLRQKQWRDYLATCRANSWLLKIGKQSLERIDIELTKRGRIGDE
jgi:hypothetical protein